MITWSVQAGTIYDQNHNDNHRNSMASQSLLLDLEEGDRVQVSHIDLLIRPPVDLFLLCIRCMCTPSQDCMTRAPTI